MRIVYIHQHFRTPDMSGGTRSFEIARRLVARGHSVDMITACTAPRAGTAEWIVTVEAGIKVHWCQVPYANEMGVLARLAAFSRFAVQAALRARTIPQDLVLATSTPLTVAVPGAFSAWRHQVGMVFEVRDVWPEVPIALGALRDPVSRILARGLEAWAYRRSRAVIVLSPDMATSVTSRFPGLDVSIIPNACDVAAFAGVTPAEVTAFRATRTWLGDRPLVIYTGTLGAVNNVGYVVELARRLRHQDPDVRFLLVGDGKEKAEVERLARRGGVLNTNLFMEPPVPKLAVPTLLAAADLAMSTVAPIPELYANSANKVFDAIAAGCPVVINHDGWLRDVLEDSGAGFALPAGDPGVGASVLAERIRDAGWLDRASAACRRLASERFDRDLLFDRFERILLRAARESRSSVAKGDLAVDQDESVPVPSRRPRPGRDQGRHDQQQR